MQSYVKMKFENGILYGKYNKSLVIDLEVAKTVIEYRKKLTNYKNAPILVDARDVNEITSEARKLFSSTEGYELLNAAGILVDSKFQTFVANFLLKVNFKKTPIPIKLFTNESDAIIWLEEYK